MKQTAREKIALGVFALGVLVMFVMAAVYVVLGHSWNVAASHIDLSIDALDRFDVIVYDGMSTRYFSDYDEETATPEQQAAARAAARNKTIVAAKYRSAGASVIELNTEEPDAYRDGMVLLRDGVRYGVFSVSTDDTQAYIQETVDWFADKNVRAVIAIVPYASSLTGVTGVDVAICRNDPLSTYDEGKNSKGTFFVSPPNKDGSVGAILLSSNDAILTKNFYDEEDVSVQDLFETDEDESAFDNREHANLAVMVQSALKTSMMQLYEILGIRET